MLKTGFTDVESILFEQLDRLNDLTPEEINTDLGKAELKRSYAVQKKQHVKL